METITAVIITVLVMLVAVGGYIIRNLLLKVEKLEDIAVRDNEYITSFSTIIEQSNNRLIEIDAKGSFKADDEIGWFFEQLKQIQEILNEYNVNK